MGGNAKGGFWYCTYEGGLAAIKKNPKLVRSFFLAPSVAYITDW